MYHEDNIFVVIYLLSYSHPTSSAEMSSEPWGWVCRIYAPQKSEHSVVDYSHTLAHCVHYNLLQIEASQMVMRNALIYVGIVTNN